MIGNRIIRLKETDSTNAYTTRLLEADTNVEEGTVIVAKHQKAGKGTWDNSWESEKGKNLTISIVLYPTFLLMEKQFIINKVVSLSLFDFLISQIDEKEIVKIKWPNDIYVGNKKISGTLVENAISGRNFQHSIIGIGININQQVFMSDAPNPVSLKNITGKDYDLEQCLSLLCLCLERRYFQLKRREEKLINEQYFSALFRLGEKARYIYKERMIRATITGLTEQGKLLLEKDNGQLIDCDFKEMEFVL